MTPPAWSKWRRTGRLGPLLHAPRDPGRVSSLRALTHHAPADVAEDGGSDPQFIASADA